MPLTSKGKKILKAFKKQYKSEGEGKAEEYFYSSINAGKIKGAEMRKKKHK